MPIPEFTANGYFPTGEHNTTIDEIYTRFVTNEHRQVMWVRFRNFIRYVTEMDCFCEIILFGSFFSDEPNPTDIDIALRFKTEYLPNNVNANIFNKEYNRNEFGVDVCIIEPLNNAYRNIAPKHYDFSCQNLHLAKILTREEAIVIGQQQREPLVDYLNNPIKGVLKIVL